MGMAIGGNAMGTKFQWVWAGKFTIILTEEFYVGRFKGSSVDRNFPVGCHGWCIRWVASLSGITHSQSTCQVKVITVWMTVVVPGLGLPASVTAGLLQKMAAIEARRPRPDGQRSPLSLLSPSLEGKDTGGAWPGNYVEVYIVISWGQ